MELFKDAKVNNELEAYLLGFIYADGFITKKVKDKYYVLGIKLAAKDKSFLEKLAKIFNRVIKEKISTCNNKQHKTAQLIVGDVNLVTRLNKLGIFPQKTYNKNCDIFDKVPNQYKYAFIRGYFDGDGTVNIHKKRANNYYQLGFVSHNKEILEKLLNYFIENLNIGKYSKIRKDGNNYRLIIPGNNNCIIFRDFIYQNYCGQTICLERKRNIFLSINKLTTKINSPYIGVYYYSKNKKWAAQIYININLQRKHLGLFNSPREAAIAYNNEALKLNKKNINIITKENDEKYLIARKMVS